MSTESAREHQFIRAEIARIGARRVLEIGAQAGETTVVLCDAVAPLGGHVAVIDPMSWGIDLVTNALGVPLPRSLAWVAQARSATSRASAAASAWSRLGYERAFRRRLHAAGHGDRVTLFRALSTDPRLIARRDPRLDAFDLVYLDGDHNYDAVWSDLVVWGGRVRAGGVILLRDVTARFPHVVKAFRRVGRDPRYRVSAPKEAGTIGKIEVVSG